MYELNRRFATIWFAGQVGNARLVDYLIREIERIQRELAERAPTVDGVDVAERLETDVVEPLQDVSKAADESDLGGFDDRYESIMENCDECHADTGYGFIGIKEPRANPYSNLDVAAD